MVVYLSDSAVCRQLDLDLSLKAVRETFRREIDGAVLLTKPRVDYLLFPGFPYGYRLKGAAFPDLKVAGLRVARHILLSDWPDLVPFALVDEQTAYQYRVGAVTTVALEALARKRFDHLCLFGAGRLARATLRALTHRFEFEAVSILSRNPASRMALAEMSSGWGISGVARWDAEKAVREADLIVTITTADEPLVRRDWVSNSATVVSMGGAQELDFELLARAGDVFVDDLAGCLESGDLARAKAAGHDPTRWVSGTLAGWWSGATSRSKSGPLILIPRGMASMDVMQAYRVWKRHQKREGNNNG